MKKKMSTKTAMTGAIIVMVIWFALWGLGYRYLAKIANEANTQGYIQRANSYLSQDESFLEKYGQLKEAITPISQVPTHSEDESVDESYMDFTCITDKGEWTIRVYHTWNETDGEVLRYEELPAN